MLGRWSRRRAASTDALVVVELPLRGRLLVTVPSHQLPAFEAALAEVQADQVDELFARFGASVELA